MAQVEQGSDRYQELFGQLPELFESALPPYDAYVVGLANPDIHPDNINEEFGISEAIGSRGVLQRQAVRDLQQGTRHMLRHMATRLDFGEDAGLASAGVLSRLSPALTDVTRVATLASQLDVAGVDAALGVTKHVGPEGTLVRAAFGVGMTALSAMGPVGMAAAAIVGFVSAIFSAFRSRKIREAESRKERQKAAFEVMPPLQEPHTDLDTWYVRSVILSVMESGRWTRLFQPRFDPRKEWCGAKRNGGFAFAPGDTTGGEDEFGDHTITFKTNGGVGFIPGRNEITSVIQVGLDPFDPSVEAWYNPKTASAWPIKQLHVTDVGSFYVNTGRLASIAWAWVTQQEASPDLYKVHVGTPDAPHEESLHYQWQEYCAGGLRYLMTNAVDWAAVSGRQKRMYDPEDRSYLFGMAIGCAIGAWRCYRWENQFRQKEQPSAAEIRFELSKVYGLNHELGCVATPPVVLQQGEGAPCFGTMYETSIQPTLVALRARQLHFLKHSLVCAYVRKQWDAFRDPALEQLLGSMRQKLLEHPDRRLIDLRDVPREETHNGRNWYDQLVEAGAGKSKSVGWIAGATGTIEPGGGPAPTVPGDDVPMPFAGVKARRATLVWPPPAETSPWRRLAAGAGVAALVGAGAYGLYRWRSREVQDG